MSQRSRTENPSTGAGVERPQGRAPLRELPDGQVRWTMRKAWSDGTTAFVFTKLELTHRLAAYVVPKFRALRFTGGQHAVARKLLIRA